MAKLLLLLLLLLDDALDRTAAASTRALGFLLFPELLGATKTITGAVAIENFGAHATAHDPFHLLQCARRLCLALDVVR